MRKESGKFLLFVSFVFHLVANLGALSFFSFPSHQPCLILTGFRRIRYVLPAFPPQVRSPAVSGITLAKNIYVGDFLPKEFQERLEQEIGFREAIEQAQKKILITKILDTGRVAIRNLEAYPLSSLWAIYHVASSQISSDLTFAQFQEVYKIVVEGFKDAGITKYLDQSKAYDVYKGEASRVWTAIEKEFPAEIPELTHLAVAVRDVVQEGVINADASDKIFILTQRMEELVSLAEFARLLREKDPQIRNELVEELKRVGSGRGAQAINDALETVKEAVMKVEGFALHPQQYLGGYLLFKGGFSLDMKTGEGKTLTEVTAAYLLNKAAGKKLIIFEAKDELAKKDIEETDKIYKALNLKVGIINEKNVGNVDIESYDVIYAEASRPVFHFMFQFFQGFTHSYDNWRAIASEEDAVLIESAMSPMIISGDKISLLVPDKEFLLSKSEAARQEITKPGGFIDRSVKGEISANKFIEELAGRDIWLARAAETWLFYHKDVHYVIERGKIVIIGELTQEARRGQQWMAGLHQLIEAKEGLSLSDFQRTQMLYTLSQFFGKRLKLQGGSTGSADPFADFLKQTYGLETIRMPRSKPLRRDEYEYLFFNENKRLEYTIDKIKELTRKGHPILIWQSTILDVKNYRDSLIKKGIPSNKIQILTAQEAMQGRVSGIVKQAGQSGMITIATDLGGRGLNIKPHKEHLVVIIPALPSEWSLIQIGGRTGRHGAKGELYILISHEELKAAGINVPDSLFGESGFIDLESDSLEISLLNKQIDMLQKQRTQLLLSRFTLQLASQTKAVNMIDQFIAYDSEAKRNPRQLARKWLNDIDKDPEIAPIKDVLLGIINNCDPKLVLDAIIKAIYQKMQELLNPPKITDELFSYIKSLDEDLFWKGLKKQAINNIARGP
jgi:hypothetical protein